MTVNLKRAARAPPLYRALSANIRAETARTLTVIAEQKRQQIESWLAQAQRDAELYFSGTSQAKRLFGQWLDSGRREQALLTQIQDRLADLTRARQWSGVAMIDTTGRPVLVSKVASPAVHGARRSPARRCGSRPPRLGHCGPGRSPPGWRRRPVTGAGAPARG